jgi:hypothetical protein
MIMDDFILKFVLGQNDNVGGIIELLLFVFFVVAVIIKNLFTVKQQQNQKQNLLKRKLKSL